LDVFPDGFTAVGRVLGPHGVHGDVKVEPQTWDPKRILKIKEAHLWSRGRLERRSIQAARVAGPVWLVRFEGFDAPETAKVLNGSLLLVPDSDVVRPPGGWIAADLVGISIVDESGIELGHGDGLADLPTEAVKAKALDGGTLVLPLEGPLAAKIELDAKRIVVDRELWDAMR
jgi:16S rRNA processing protein RimM